MGCYTYINTLRFLFMQKSYFVANSLIAPSVEDITIFVSLKNVVNYDDFRVWQALFLINYFTGKGGSVVGRGYKRLGREKFHNVEVSVILREDAAYEFLYFLYAFVLPGLEFGGLYEHEFREDKSGRAVLFFSIRDLGDVDILDSRSEFVG